VPAVGIAAPAMLDAFGPRLPLSSSLSIAVVPSEASSVSRESPDPLVEPAVITVANTLSPGPAVKR
jgi:hypothetical protein